MTTSSSFRNFRERLREVGTLRTLCVREDVRPRERERARKRNVAVCRAALVLLCSHMEGFFEDLTADILQFHESNRTPLKAMPLRLRVAQVWRYVHLPEGASDERKWSALQAVRTSNVVDETANCASGMLDAELHTKGFAVPGSSEVEGLLKSVGVPNVWTAIDGELKTRHAWGPLDALVYRRHPIAHGEQGAKATPDDVSQYIVEMQKLAAAFDVVVARCLEYGFAVADPWSLLV